MSTMAITAAHFAGLPARYAVGRWSHVSTSSLLVFNAAELGLNILIRGIEEYVVTSRELKLSIYQQTALALSTRVLMCLTAWYIASLLKHPIPPAYAALTSLAAFVSIMGCFYITGLANKK